MSINPFLFNKTIKDTNIQPTKKEYDEISLTEGGIIDPSAKKHNKNLGKASDDN
jgi:hypothetical protein